MVFKDRVEAGALLAERLSSYTDSDAVVLAVPRGGVTIGEVIAKKLHLPLDIVLVKKIGHPDNSEYAVGAVDLQGHIVNNGMLPEAYLRERAEELVPRLKEKYTAYKGDAPPQTIAGKTAIITDDGIATGSTIEAVLATVHQQKPAKIVLAIPIAHPNSIANLATVVDEVVCLSQPKNFHAVGQFYHQFEQVDDATVRRLLQLRTQTRQGN